MKFKVIISPEYKILIEILHGDVDWQDIAEMILAQIKHPGYTDNYDVIVDMREAKIKFEQDDVEKLVDFMADNTHIMVRKKLAILTRQPSQVVASTLFSINMIDKRYPQTVRVFSTWQSLLSWLQVDIPSYRLQKLINEPQQNNCSILTS